MEINQPGANVEFEDEDDPSKLLQEAMDLPATRLRPALPQNQTLGSLDMYKVGAALRDEHTILNVRIIKDVRMGWEWLGGRWWRRIPTKGQLKKAGFQKAEIEDIVADLKALPPLGPDGVEIPNGMNGTPHAHAAAGSRRSSGAAAGGSGGARSTRGGAGRGGFGDEDADYEEEEEEAPEAMSLVAGRTKRVGKSRIVYVNGNPVLKSNMYDLEAGEPSVFERELARGKGDHAYLKQEGVTLSLPRPKAQVSRPRAPSAPKALPPQQVARTSHNDSIRKDAAADNVIRALYLSAHLDKLRHFVPASVVTAISRMAATAPVGWKAPATLREYQLEGVAWLVSKFDNGVNAILADEMGLGKTLQTITFLSYLKFERGVHGPHLVVVPLSVLPSWMSEFKKWCPSFRVVRLHCNDVDERQRLRKEVLANPDSFDVAVTTYDMIHSAHFGDALKHSIVWRYVVLDEAHKVKNEESLISQAMRKISRQHTLMLTGTPVQNNLHELFALLNFMYPDVFTDGAMFDNAFDLKACRVDDGKLEAAHFLLRPFLLRRIKDEVDVRLPPKVETKINCPLSEMQTFWYRRLLMRDSRVLMDMETDVQAKGTVKFDADSSAWKKMLNLLMQLRKVCNHPFMFPDAEPDFDGESTNEDIVEASGKMQVLDRMLAKLKAKDHRVVLFSQFNMMLDVVEDYLLMRGYKYRRLDGSTNRIQRMIDIEQFNRPRSDIFIYILNTRAGGLGVNLQTADTCVLMDSDFNPQCDLQAMARVHRIGQTKPVHIYRLVSDGTVEDRVQKRAESKLYLDQMVNRGSTAAAEELEGLSKKELLSMLKFGADRIFKNDSGEMPSDADLDAIIDRSKMMAKSLLPKTPAAAAGPHASLASTSSGSGSLPEAVVAAAAADADATAADAQQPGMEPSAAEAADPTANDGGCSSSQPAAPMDTDEASHPSLPPPVPASSAALVDIKMEESSEAAAAAATESRAGAREPLGSMSQPFGSTSQPTSLPTPTDKIPADAGDALPEAASLAAEAPRAAATALTTAVVTSTVTTAAATATVTAVAVVSGAGVASTSAGPSALGGGAAAMMLVDSKHTALSFDAEQAPVSTFVFGGLDYQALRAQAPKGNESLRDIAKQFWAAKRQRKERLMNIDGYDVLRENNYSIEEGGISIGIKAVKKRRKLQVAGEDYIHNDYCQVCWDGGDLLCCDHCPASYHPACLGLKPDDVPTLGKWSCPHHSCSACGRSTAAAGGLLFRCDMCQDAFCEDHLPAAYEMVGENELFKALGQMHPKQACFVTCTEECKQLKLQMTDTIETSITERRRDYDERMEALRVSRQQEAERSAGAASQVAAAAQEAKAAKKPKARKQHMKHSEQKTTGRTEVLARARRASTSNIASSSAAALMAAAAAAISAAAASAAAAASRRRDATAQRREWLRGADPYEGGGKRRATIGAVQQSAEDEELDPENDDDGGADDREEADEEHGMRALAHFGGGERRTPGLTDTHTNHTNTHTNMNHDDGRGQ
ncbi:MAG: hypothetical protein WDW36_001466 [Sanguina aurantia]